MEQDEYPSVPHQRAAHLGGRAAGRALGNITWELQTQRASFAPVGFAGLVSVIGTRRGVCAWHRQREWYRRGYSHLCLSFQRDKGVFYSLKKAKAFSNGDLHPAARKVRPPTSRPNSHLQGEKYFLPRTCRGRKCISILRPRRGRTLRGRQETFEPCPLCLECGTMTPFQI